MKSLLIEAVSNGWLVRPFAPCEHWASGNGSPNVFVYTTVAALQSALPELLKHEEITNGIATNCTT